MQQFFIGGTMSTVHTTQLKNAVHPSIKSPKANKPKTKGELMVSKLVNEGAFPFKVQIAEYAAQPFCLFWRDVALLWGASGALGPIEYGTIGTRTKKSGQPPIATDAMLRIEHTLAGFRDHERYLFEWLLKACARTGSSLTKLGRDIYGADHDVLARERSTVRIQALSDTIYQLYPQRSAAGDYRAHMERLLIDRAARWHAEQKGIPISAAA